MKKLFAAIAVMLLAACTSLGITPPSNDSEAGPVLSGKLYGQTAGSYIPFTDVERERLSPTIATKAFVEEGFATKASGEGNAKLATVNIFKAGQMVTMGDGGFRFWLNKYTSGSGHNDAAKTLDNAGVYMQIGGREYGAGTYRMIGFGYVPDATTIPATQIGYQEKNTSGGTFGDFIVATRNSTSYVAPTVRLRVTSAGDIQGEGTYAPTTDQSLTTKKYVDASLAAKKGAAVPDVTAAPTQAQFNALLKSLRDAGLLAPTTP